MQNLEDNKNKKSLKQKLIEFDWLTLFLAIIVITVFTIITIGAITTMTQQ